MEVGVKEKDFSFPLKTENRFFLFSGEKRKSSDEQGSLFGDLGRFTLVSDEWALSTQE
jgi:hypothetical protein